MKNVYEMKFGDAMMYVRKKCKKWFALMDELVNKC